MGKPINILPGARKGTVTVPHSKSHLHRILIADFLGGGKRYLEEDETDSDDILATRRCLKALSTDALAPHLDVGESGSTLRFLRPVAAVLGKRADFIMHGNLASRPDRRYANLPAGEYFLPGNVSSQFATGLLFALPLAHGTSTIVFTSPLESHGYVDLTLDVIRKAGIEVQENKKGYTIEGDQKYHALSDLKPEGDWSGAAFWFVMNKLGSSVKVNGLNPDSTQPDHVVIDLLEGDEPKWDMSQCPDLFPALAIAAAFRPIDTTFTNITRLKLKECDRILAMEEVLTRFGIETCYPTKKTFCVKGGKKFLKSGAFWTKGDHRIAMAIATGATRACGTVWIDDTGCAAKSYPTFFKDFLRIS